MLALDSDKVTWMSRCLPPNKSIFVFSKLLCLQLQSKQQHMKVIEMAQVAGIASRLWLGIEHREMFEGQGQTGRVDRSIHLLRLHPVYRKSRNAQTLHRPSPTVISRVFWSRISRLQNQVKPNMACIASKTS